MNLHTELAENIQRDFGDRLRSAPELSQDALTLTLDNDVVLVVRYAATDAYSLRWQTGPDAPQAGIDTAPSHPQLETRPNHLHLADGRVVADPLTRIDATPSANVAVVIRALLESPQLASAADA